VSKGDDSGRAVEIRINGPVYVAANAVVAAIDALAALLTGDPQFFWNKAAPPKSTPTTGEGACGEASISSPQKVIHNSEAGGGASNSIA
jgi:hypothetical protein